ncbi:BamA/OMP85 family outer membrane protein [Megamonas funiformis]|uniref:BamA/OMP85 family outer membrane protein n=1 Tax=Megamonas funiformis TaxID=437897 RepID=UPI00195F0681|nr:outer membrane protein assembly factor [Megamonas funiformis]MBM6726741.1 outer membrane protein assembly factor [Megamonas funiformis]
MKQKNYKLLVCALAMANISAFSINNCFANVADNNVHENIVSAESLTEEEVAAKVDETMQDVSADNETAKEDKEIVINNDKKNKVDKVQDPEAIAKMNTWKEQRPTEETIKNNNSAYTDMTVVSVDVVGNEKIAKEDILNVLTVKAGDKFNIKNIEQDRNNIYNTGYFYDNYPSYEVVPEGVKITYHVMENPVLNSVEILGNQVYSTDKIEDMLTVKKGEILNIRQLNTDLANIEASYRQDGYILAKLRDISIDESGNLTLTFNEGILEGYVVKGNDKTKDYVITREMRIKPGEVFDAKKARRSMQRVYNLGFFEDVSVKILPGKEDPNNIIMELTVIEKRTGSFGIGAGYSSEDGLLGMVSIGDTNFRGTGDSVKAMYEFGGDGGDDSGYSISYTKPWLDEKETTGTFRIYDRKFEYDDYDNDGDLIETYDKKNQGYELNFGRPTDEYTMNYLGFKINNTEYRGHEDGPYNRDDSKYEEWRDNNFGETRSIIASQVRDTRDNIFYPTEGTRTSLSVEYAGLGGDFDYTKLTGSIQKYYKVGHAQVLALRGSAGYANEDLPEAALFEVGGQNSVRGYRDGQFSGNKMLMGTVEYRFPLVNKVQGALFTDVGDAWGGKSWGPWSSIEEDLDLHASVGVGLQMQTPIGALRLDYGWGEDGGRLHFNVGGNF